MMPRTPILRSLILAAVIALVSSIASLANAQLGDEWIFVGNDPLAKQVKIYVMDREIRDLGERNYYAPSFSVYPVTIRGIDEIDVNNQLYYRSLPHRSVLRWSLYDCERRVSATYESHYFTSDVPKSSALVYLYKDTPTIMLPEIVSDPVMAYICD